MFVASLSNIKMDCLGIRFYWLFICDRGPQSKSINQSAVAESKLAAAKYFWEFSFPRKNSVLVGPVLLIPVAIGVREVQRTIQKTNECAALVSSNW